MNAQCAAQDANGKIAKIIIENNFIRQKSESSGVETMKISSITTENGANNPNDREGVCAGNDLEMIQRVITNQPTRQL